MSTFQTEMTTWYNPTEVPVRFRLFVAQGAGRQAADIRDVEVAPKGEVQIPAAFDDAIKSDIGAVPAGLAPQLVKGGKPAEPQTPKTESSSPKKDK